MTRRDGVRAIAALAAYFGLRFSLGGPRRVHLKGRGVPKAYIFYGREEHTLYFVDEIAVVSEWMRGARVALVNPHGTVAKMTYGPDWLLAPKPFADPVGIAETQAEAERWVMASD